MSKFLDENGLSRFWSNLKDRLVGKKTTGETYTYTLDDSSVEATAGEGAEIFNYYSGENRNLAIGDYSHAEGQATKAIGISSHAEGWGNTAIGSASHVEGSANTASGGISHAEGYYTTASGNQSHAEGYRTTASGTASHAEGVSVTASGDGSHAEGGGTTASGVHSHAEGIITTASGEGSHAEGNKTIAASQYQHVQGKFNVEDSNGKFAFIIGNGIYESKRSNAFAIDWSGLIYQKNSATGVDLNKGVQAITKLVDDGTKNLLKITATSQTINGVTFTVNADQTVTVNGTNTKTNAATFILVPNQQAILIPDGEYYLLGCPQGGSYDTFYLCWKHSQSTSYDTGNGSHITKSGDTINSNIAIVVNPGVTVNNITFKPMICIVEYYNFSSEFVPYAKSNYELTQATEPIPRLVDAGAKNLQVLRDQNATVQGISLVLKDGVISASGTATGTPSSIPVKPVLLPPGDYILSGCPANGSDTTYSLVLFASTDGGTTYTPYDNKVDYGNGVSFTLSEQLYVKLVIHIQNGYVASNLVFKPMICTAEDYAISPKFVPYTPTMREMYEYYADPDLREWINEASGYGKITILKTGAQKTAYDSTNKKLLFYFHMQAASDAFQLRQIGLIATNNAAIKYQLTLDTTPETGATYVKTIDASGVYGANYSWTKTSVEPGATWYVVPYMKFDNGDDVYLKYGHLYSVTVNNDGTLAIITICKE